MRLLTKHNVHLVETIIEQTIERVYFERLLVKRIKEELQEKSKRRGRRIDLMVHEEGNLDLFIVEGALNSTLRNRTYISQLLAPFWRKDFYSVFQARYQPKTRELLEQLLLSQGYKKVPRENRSGHRPLDEWTVLSSWRAAC